MPTSVVPFSLSDLPTEIFEQILLHVFGFFKMRKRQSTFGAFSCHLRRTLTRCGPSGDTATFGGDAARLDAQSSPRGLPCRLRNLTAVLRTCQRLWSVGSRTFYGMFEFCCDDLARYRHTCLRRVGGMNSQLIREVTMQLRTEYGMYGPGNPSCLTTYVAVFESLASLQTLRFSWKSGV
jgi:hypothetical protein